MSTERESLDAIAQRVVRELSECPIGKYAFPPEAPVTACEAAVQAPSMALQDVVVAAPRAWPSRGAIAPALKLLLYSAAIVSAAIAGYYATYAVDHFIVKQAPHSRTTGTLETGQHAGYFAQTGDGK